MAIEFASLMEPVARLLLGEPNRALSSKTELRYGKRGSLSVDLAKGTWFDHEANEGGGALDLVARETHLEGADRFDWLRRNGFAVDDGPRTNGQHGPKLGPIVATYDYVDETGILLFQVTRHDPKDFRQRRPDKSAPGGWSWGVRGVRQVPYRLPDLIEHLDRVVFVVEGEKDADRLWSLNIPATTNAGGAGKWREELSQFFQNCDVVVIPDRDPQKKHPKTGDLMFHPDGRPILPGQDHGQHVARSLSSVAASVRVLELWKHWPEMPLKGDVSDWLSGGHDTVELFALIEQTPTWSPDQTTDEPTTPETMPLPWIAMSLWDGAPIPERQWAILNRAPLNQAGLFSGEGGTGKSIIELTKNVAHVAGKDWLGSMPEQGPTFYIGAEDEADELHRRLAAIVAHYQRGDSKVTFARLVKDGLHVMSLIGRDASLVAVNKSGKIETTALYNQIYEAAGDIKPKNISIDTLSHAFAGNEIDRVQVYGFAIQMQKLAIAACGSVTILSHPSLAGMASGSGISGSTAWHSAFRFRHYLKGAKKNGSEDESISDVRQIEFKKNQYGPLGETILVRYQNGLFLPDAASERRTATPEEADAVFLDLLRRFTKANRPVSDRKGTTYAPAAFAKEDETTRLNLDNRKLEAAMSRLFKAGKIVNETTGPQSRRRTHIALVEQLL